jgi:hypothetical protein
MASRAWRWASFSTPSATTSSSSDCASARMALTMAELRDETAVDLDHA